MASTQEVTVGDDLWTQIGPPGGTEQVIVTIQPRTHPVFIHIRPSRPAISDFAGAFLVNANQPFVMNLTDASEIIWCRAQRSDVSVSFLA